jgi:hypothetical protein
MTWTAIKSRRRGRIRCSRFSPQPQPLTQVADAAVVAVVAAAVAQRLLQLLRLVMLPQRPQWVLHRLPPQVVVVDVADAAVVVAEAATQLRCP